MNYANVETLTTANVKELRGKNNNIVLEYEPVNRMPISENINVFENTPVVVDLKKNKGCQKPIYLQEKFLTADEILNERIKAETQELQLQMKSQFQERSIDWKLLKPLI